MYLYFFYIYFDIKKTRLIKNQKKLKKVAFNPRITPILEIQHSMIFISFYALLNSAQILLISLLSICTLLLFKNRFKVSGGKKFGSK
jgi:hypothetical protein